MDGARDPRPGRAVPVADLHVALGRRQGEVDRVRGVHSENGVGAVSFPVWLFREFVKFRTGNNFGVLHIKTCKSLRLPRYREYLILF